MTRYKDIKNFVGQKKEFRAVFGRCTHFYRTTTENRVSQSIVSQQKNKIIRFFFDAHNSGLLLKCIRSFSGSITIELNLFLYTFGHFTLYRLLLVLFLLQAISISIFFHHFAMGIYMLRCLSIRLSIKNAFGWFCIHFLMIYVHNDPKRATLIQTKTK